MDYEKAKAIAAEVKPDLVIDPQHKTLPHMLVVRRRADSAHSHSITLGDALPDPDRSQEDTDAMERKVIVDALASADRMLP